MATWVRKRKKKLGGGLKGIIFLLAMEKLARNCKKFHFPINSRYSSPVLIKYGIKADVSLQFFISWPQKALNLEKNALKFESRLWIWFEIINYFRIGLVKFMLNLFDIIVFAIVKTFCQIYIIFKKKLFPYLQTLVIHVRITACSSKNIYLALQHECCITKYTIWCPSH